MEKRLSCTFTFLLVVFALACSKDKDAPPPPQIDPVESPTASTQIVVTGTAEFGATIEISGAASYAPMPLNADPFTARFAAVVTLQEGVTNALSFSARDHAGNRSAATQVDVAQENGHNQPSELSLQLFVNGSETPTADPVVLSAGDTLHAVTSTQDAAGHVLALPIGLSTSIPQAFVAGADVSNIHTAGDFAVAATVAGSLVAKSRPVTVTAGKAVAIELSALPPTVSAGTKIFVDAVAHDAFGNVVSLDNIDLTSDPPLVSQYEPACTSQSMEQGFVDAQHFVAFDVSAAADQAYVFTLTATSGAVSAQTPVTVKPGVAARFAPLDPADCAAGDAFAFTDATWSTDASLPVSIAAGGALYYRYAVVDAYGNATVGPVSVVTTAPGASVIDDGVSGVGQVAHVITAGSFELSAYVAGISASVVKDFSVDVGGAYSASMFLSSTLASPEDTIYAFATVHDAYGNVVACPSGNVDPSVLEMLPSPAATADGQQTTCSNGVFQRAFTFSENGTYSVTATYKPGGPVQSSSFVTILGIDATPPSVAIENVLVDGTPCTPAGSPLSCAVKRGSLIDFDLVADDNIALSELQYSAFFQTTGTLRTRDLLVSSGSSLPATTHFSFTVPSSALQEDVPLVGLAIDSSGNRATTDELVLRVGVYATFGRNVEVVAVGGSLSRPTDVAFNASGDMFIANDGAQNLLKVASGSSAPVVFSSFGRNSRYIAVDSGGNIYLTDTTRVSKISAAGDSVVNYLNLTGNQAKGLAIVAPTMAKGTVDAAAATDGARVTVAGQTFELDVTGDGCSGGPVCVNVGGGGKNQTLATSIDANSAQVHALYDATSSKVVLAARSAGEAGDTLTLTTTGMTISGATLSQGHEEEIFLGQNNDNNIYRFPENLTPTANIAANHGSFNVGATQAGIAIKDASTATSAALRDLFLYFVDDQNPSTVRAYRAVDAAAPTQVFALSSGGGQSFDTLYDVVLEPTSPVPASNPVNGCLLVSDDVKGNIYAIDTRVPTSASPTVTLVASGFNDPRGLAFYGGDLYVTDRGDEAVIRLSPSASSPDCF